MAIRKFSKRKVTGEVYYRWGYDFYNENTGKRHRLTDCKTKGEAENKYKIALKKLDEKELAKKSKFLTFGQLTDSFLESHCKVHCSLATQNKYHSLNKTHIKPYFGDKRVLDIKTIDVNKFIAHLQDEKHLAEKSINLTIGFLSTIFNFGIDNDLTNNNPCRKIKKLRLPHKEKNFLIPEQVMELLEACKTHSPKFYAILYTAVFTGMRKGEICALRWDKIDFKAKKILIDKSMYKNTLQEPKTLQSIRKVDMIDSLAQVLKEYRASSQLNEYVFWGEKGTPLSGDATLWRHFNSVASKCGLKDITFHDLRHTFASLLIAKNVPIKYIQRQLGHSTIKMTMDTYGHLMPDVYDQAICVLEEVANYSKNIDTRKFALIN